MMCFCSHQPQCFCRRNERFGAPSHINDCGNINPSIFWAHPKFMTFRGQDIFSLQTFRKSNRIVTLKCNYDAITSLIPAVCCWVTDYSPALAVHCLAWCVATVALTLRTDVLHLFHPTGRMRPSRRLPPLPLTVSPRPPLPQPPPPLSHFLLVSVAQASSLSAKVCADTAGVHHAWLLGGGRSVRESSCGRLRTRTEKPQQESRLNGPLLILSSPNCLCLIMASHL